MQVINNWYSFPRFSWTEIRFNIDQDLCQSNITRMYYPLGQKHQPLFFKTEIFWQDIRNCWQLQGFAHQIIKVSIVDLLLIWNLFFIASYIVGFHDTPISTKIKGRGPGINSSQSKNVGNIQLSMQLSHLSIIFENIWF